MTRKRRLSPDERALWDRVAKSADPLQNRPKATTPAEQEKPFSKRAPDPTPRIERFEVGSKSDHSRDHDLMSSLTEQLSGNPLNMDRRTHTRMKRGKLRPEGRIDLHGMTMAQAHPALLNFILSSHASGKRLVLVITGKGKHRDAPGPIPTRHGVLRHQVPQWLKMAPLAPVVMQVTEAHISHGGTGAFYVYLRRSR
ncbi:Smr/MutS family protein [Pelagovum pacificum]|uniref:DNA mismatch repair protein MutS n=1 Tax=Pelagovum pacificum TaxID=2588711 RepID=A0A5C5GIN5_9RHOB|nr:Smr/MutS family protein [Pelagovum pacificum]QQA42768.1 Smr/MutS family protein [Pelagovum pacificum]TNY34084.1 DNA mismatch repair protein MutS [Pelagovum pacificum]